MTQRLCKVSSQRFQVRDKEKPWVFWHRYRSRKTWEDHRGTLRTSEEVDEVTLHEGQSQGVPVHALRHSGASLMENNNVPVGAIQTILGHSRRGTTEIYLHNLGDLERQAIAIYEEVSQKSDTPIDTP